MRNVESIHSFGNIKLFADPRRMDILRLLMASPATQEVTGQFGFEEFGQPLFYPDADKTDADLGCSF